MSKKFPKMLPKVHKKTGSDFTSDDDYKSEVNESLAMECCCCYDCGGNPPEDFLSDGFYKPSFDAFDFFYNYDLNNNFKLSGSRKKKSKKSKKKKEKRDDETKPPSISSSRSFTKNKNGGSTTVSTVISLRPSTEQNNYSDGSTTNLTKSYSTNDLSILKPDTPLKLKKPKYSKKPSAKLCSKLSARAPSSLNDSGFQSLCDRIKSASLTSLLPVKAAAAITSIANLSEHDRKILDRMAMRRTKEIIQIEDAMVARKYWDSEKTERAILLNKQAEHYQSLVKIKRDKENAELLRRQQVIAQKEKEYVEKIQNEIETKMVKAESILKKIEIEREIGECKRRTRENQRIEAILNNCEEHRLDDDIWRQTINEKLEQRIIRADNIREKNLDVYRTRLMTDNQIQQQMHAVNYDQTKKEEVLKKEKLRERITERDSMFKKFAEQKQKLVTDSKTQAQTSALLRDLVRRSFSTDCFKVSATPNQIRSFSGFDRPFSNLSYHSHINLS